jgi:hypothetical protein
MNIYGLIGNKDQRKEYKFRMACAIFSFAHNLEYNTGISMDYVDREGNVFEIFHYEYDCVGIESYNEIEKAKTAVEKIIESVDWNEAGKDLLRRKDEWSNLPFFAQSDWKCNYFGLPSEKFKEVCWK